MTTWIAPKSLDIDDGRVLVNVESTRAWANSCDRHLVAGALPDSDFVQLSRLRGLVYLAIHGALSGDADRSERAADIADDGAGCVIAADPDRFKSYSRLQIEQDPLYVVSTQAAVEHVAAVKAAIEAGELVEYDLTFQPIQRPKSGNMKESSSPALTGVGKAAIVGAFPPPGGRTTDQWENALGDAKRTTWLLPARVESGGRRTSALWNPAMLAVCLCDQYRATPQQRREYGRIIAKHFPEWLPEWQGYADGFE